MSSREPAVRADRAAELAEQVAQLYELVDQVIAEEGVEAIDEETIQRLATLGVKLYVARREQGHQFPPFKGESVNATEVSIMAMGMLKAVNLDVFELSLWRHWGRA